MIYGDRETSGGHWTLNPLCNRRQLTKGSGKPRSMCREWTAERYTLIDEWFKLSANVVAKRILRFSVEHATREVLRPSFTVKTPLLSRVTKLVSMGNIVFY